MGMVGAAIGIGFMLGIPIGGILAGDHAQSANFLWPAVASASAEPARAGAGEVPAARKSRAAAGHAAAPAAPRGGPLRLLRQRPRLLLIASAALLVTTSQGILESIFALWALNRFGAGPRTVAYALFGAAWWPWSCRADWCGARAAAG